MRSEGGSRSFRSDRWFKMVPRRRVNWMRLDSLLVSFTGGLWWEQGEFGGPAENAEAWLGRWSADFADGRRLFLGRGGDEL
jgi:hypothetical protein